MGENLEERSSASASERGERGDELVISLCSLDVGTMFTEVRIDKNLSAYSPKTELLMDSMTSFIYPEDIMCFVSIRYLLGLCNF